MSGLGLLQPMTRRALARPSNRRPRRADRTGLPRLSRRARLAPALPPKQPLWPSHALLRASWVCPRAHGPIRPRALAWRGRGAGDAAVFLEALVSGHSDLRPRKLVRRPSVHPELGQGQVVAGTQPPGPVLACLITYPGSENSGSHLDLGRGSPGLQ